MQTREEFAVSTFGELLDYIEHYADAIYVRKEVNGEWGNYALSTLSASEALQHAFGWIRRGIVPVRVIR